VGPIIGVGETLFGFGFSPPPLSGMGGSFWGGGQSPILGLLGLGNLHFFWGGFRGAGGVVRRGVDFLTRGPKPKGTFGGKFFFIFQFFFWGGPLGGECHPGLGPPWGSHNLLGP